MLAEKPLTYGEDAPTYYSYRSLEDLVQECTPDTLKRQEVAFAVNGFDPLDMFLNIYVRPHSKIHEQYDFPLVHIRLAGSTADEMLEEAFRAARETPRGTGPGGLMYGKGAFRSVVNYLQRELPGRGFKRIFLECVENELLGLAAERYGFRRIGDSKAPDYVKLLAP